MRKAVSTINEVSNCEKFDMYTEKDDTVMVVHLNQHGKNLRESPCVVFMLLDDIIRVRQCIHQRQAAPECSIKVAWNDEAMECVYTLQDDSKERGVDMGQITCSTLGPLFFPPRR